MSEDTPSELIEYRVRPVTRYIVTRFERGADNPGGTTRNVSSATTQGEFDNADTAYDVAYALCRQDHERKGWMPGDERIQYPQHPGEKSARAE
jgi:hypothetical protein